VVALEKIKSCNLSRKERLTNTLLQGEWWKALFHGLSSLKAAWKVRQTPITSAKKAAKIVFAFYIILAIGLFSIILYVFCVTIVWRRKFGPGSFEQSDSHIPGIELGWLWPKYKIFVTTKSRERKSEFFPALENDTEAEPGTILRTVWALNHKGDPQRIKLETFVLPLTSRDLDKQKNLLSIRDDNKFKYHLSSKPAIGTISDRKNDLLITVGDSVSPGKYLAACAEGKILIYVKA
jgi:hypothetical protein